MEAQISELVKAAQDLLSGSANDRVLIAIAGIPGSGKTTLAQKVVEGINTAQGAEIAAMVPMDGYHLTRAQLDLLPDPLTAHFRRGAPFTFDPSSLHALVLALLRPSSPGTISAPSFSHSLKDPVPHAIPIHSYHRIVVFEGLYLTLDLPVWRDIAALFTQVWFIEVPGEVAKARLVKRHLEAGIVQTREEGERRAAENDLVNAELITERVVRVDRRVPYTEDPDWAEASK
ncbi:P-loop containing nucleoside triphosphate hydrolase protein [Tirmania nivea]|nr:P-loop containing nucleoside triphosphate hydrolase protein [Tirmania nivea]